MVPVRLIFSFATCIVFASYASSSLLASDDRLLDRVPDEPGIYVWTDDATDLIQRIKQTIEKEALGQPLNDWLTKVQTGLNRVSPNSKLKARIEAALDVVKQLDEGLFDGDFLFIDQPLNNKAENGSNSYWLSSPNSVFIAHTSATEEECQRFVENVCLLRTPLWTQRLPPRRRFDPKAQTDNWRFVEPWFIWADSPERASEVASWFETAVERKLVDNRTFQTTLKRFNEFEQPWPGLRFFVSDEQLPNVFDRFNLLREFHLRLPRRDQYVGPFETLGLNEIRGVGGKFYLPSSDIHDRLNSEYAIDLFAVTTQPQNQLLALPHYQTGIDFDAPQIGRRLTSFVQLEVDESAFQSACESVPRAFNELLQNSDSYQTDFRLLPVHSLNHFERSTPELFQNINRVSGFAYQGDARTPFGWFTYGISSSNPAKLSQAISDSLNDRQPDSWQVSRDGRIKEWKLSDTAKADFQRYWNVYVDLYRRNQEAEIARYELEGNMSPEDLEKRRQNMERMISSYDSQAAQLIETRYLQDGSFFLATPITPPDEGFDSDEEDSATAQRLVQLRKDHDQICEELEIKPCGILCHWSEQLFIRNTFRPQSSQASELRSKYQEFAARQALKSNVANGDEHVAIAELSIANDLIKYRFWSMLDRVVITLEDHPNGFRVTGIAALKPNDARFKLDYEPQEEETEVDDE